MSVMLPFHDVGTLTGTPPTTTDQHKSRRAALRNVMSLLSTEWTRDHLLGVAPTSDAAILSSPLQQLHSLSFKNDMTFDGLNPGKTHLNGVLSGNLLVVPAYSKDNMSAGYMVEESYGLYPEEVPLCYNGLSATRFIACEDNGTFIGVVQLPTAEGVIHFSSKNRTCMFHGFEFPAGTLKMLASAGANVDAYEAAMRAVIVAENLQQCTNCGASGGTPCACPSLVIRPKSPLDLGPISYNVRQACVGLEMGKGSCLKFKDGVLNESLDIVAHHRIVNVPKHGAAQKLVNWAISDALKTVPIAISRVIRSPLSSPNHTLSMDSEFMSSTFNTFNNAYTADSLLLLDNQRTSSDVSQETTGIERALDLRDLSGPAIVPTLDAVPAIDVSDASSFWQPSPPVAETSAVGMAQTTNATAPLGPPPYPQLMSSQATNMVPSTMKLAPAPVLPTQEAAVGTIPIAPLRASNAPPPAAPATATEAMEEKMRRTAEELRAWKAYQRKLRNRESAARSNMARKQRRLEQARQKKQNASSAKAKG